MSPFTLTSLPSSALPAHADEPAHDAPHGERSERLGALALLLVVAAIGVAFCLPLVV